MLWSPHLLRYLASTASSSRWSMCRYILICRSWRLSSQSRRIGPMRRIGLWRCGGGWRPRGRGGLVSWWCDWMGGKGVNRRGRSTGTFVGGNAFYLYFPPCAVSPQHAQLGYFSLRRNCQSRQGTPHLAHARAPQTPGVAATGAKTQAPLSKLRSACRKWTVQCHRVLSMSVPWRCHCVEVHHERRKASEEPMIFANFGSRTFSLFICRGGRNLRACLRGLLG